MVAGTKNPPKGAAKPGTKSDAGKKPVKEKKTRQAYTPTVDDPSWVNEDGLLTALPEDYDPRAHLPLKRKDFADEALYYEWLAGVYEVRAKKLRQKAVDFKKMGSVRDRGKAKRLLNMQKRMAELRKQLEDEGVDVAAMLETIEEPAEEETEAAATTS